MKLAKLALISLSLFIGASAMARPGLICIAQDQLYSYGIRSWSFNERSGGRSAFQQCLKNSATPRQCYFLGCVSIPEFDHPTAADWAAENEAMKGLPGYLPSVPRQPLYQGIIGVPAGSTRY